MVQGIAGVGATSNAIEIQTEYQARVAVLMKRATEQAGESAIQLIEAATATAPGQGGNLNVKA